MKSYVFSVVLLLIYFTTAFAQEDVLTAEEILNWFPLDTYESIYHEETAALRAGKSYGVYKVFGSNSFVARQLPLPDSIKEQLESFTGAQLVRLYVYVQDPDMGKQKQGSNKMMSVDVGGKAYAVESVGEHIWVARLFDPIGVIKKALETGDLAETENSVHREPVYSYRYKDMYKKEETVFFCLMPTGELLIAGDVSLVRRMAAAGLGEEMNITGDPDLKSFEEILPYAGQSAYWSSFVPHRKAVLQKAEKDGADTEAVEKARANMRRFPVYVFAYDVTGTMIGRRISCYVDEKTAEQVSRPDHRPRTNDPYTNAMFDVQRKTREGSLIIYTIVYEEETVEKLKAARDESRKLNEQRRKEREEKAEEKKEKK